MPYRFGRKAQLSIFSKKKCTAASIGALRSNYVSSGSQFVVFVQTFERYVSVNAFFQIFYRTERSEDMKITPIES